MYQKEVMSSELTKFGASIDAMIAESEREKDPFEGIDALDMELSLKYDLEKILKNDCSDSEVLSKLASEMDAEEAALLSFCGDATDKD
jgi:hypothetical protein